MQTAGGDDDAPSPEAEPEAAPARKETKAQAAKRKKEEEVDIALPPYKDHQLTLQPESHSQNQSLEAVPTAAKTIRFR